MKKLALCFVLVLCLCLALCTCAFSEGSFTLNQEALELAVGGKATLKTETKGIDTGKYPKYQWESSDPDTIRVSGAGYVTALDEGSAVITCTLTTRDGTIYTATCPVSAYRPVTSVKCDISQATLCVGQMLELTTTVKPADASDLTVEYSSSDETVCTVNEQGIITAVGAGKCKIAYKPARGTAKGGKVTVTVPTLAVIEPEYTIDTTEPLTVPVAFYGSDPSAIRVKLKDTKLAMVELDGSNIIFKPLAAGSSDVTVTDSLTKSSIHFTLNVSGTSIPVHERIALSGVSYRGSKLTVDAKNRTGVGIAAVTWRCRFYNTAGVACGDTDLAFYARGRETTSVGGALDKTWKNGAKKTLSYKVENEAYDGAAEVYVAMSGYITETGEIVTIPESQLYWVSSLRNSEAPEGEYVACLPLTAEEQAAADAASIGWKTRLMAPEHAKRLRIPQGGLMITGFYAHSLAEQNGLKMYDVITSINGISYLDDPYAADRAALELAGGKPIEITLIRGSEELTVTIGK